MNIKTFCLATPFVLGACAGRHIRVVNIDHPRAKMIVYADPNTVYENCFDFNSRSDSGHRLHVNDNLGGCFNPTTQTIWINTSCETGKVLAHEMAHADGILTPKEVGEKYPADCNSYQFGRTHIGGSYKAVGDM